MEKLFKYTLHQKIYGWHKHLTSSVFRKMKIKATMDCEGPETLLAC